MQPTEKFWSRVGSATPEGCWPWVAGKGSDGRGRMHWRGKHTLAYRISWELANGAPPPADMHVCHRCDNPACVRPSHLFLGRDLENVRDMWAKGRAIAPPVHQGVTHPLAHSTDDVVRDARESYAEGRENAVEIAERTGHAPSTVRAWLSGATRREAGGPTAAPHPRNAPECPHGHPWTPENTRWDVRQDGSHKRKCRACGRRRAAEARQRRKTGAEATRPASTPHAPGG